MTYAEAAAFLGIKPESVKRQARAKRWPRMLGNDGRALVKVPDLPPGGVREASPEDESPRNPPQIPPLMIRGRGWRLRKRRSGCCGSGLKT